jgi:hypothetical protein
LCSECTVIYPQPSIVIGISPKSHGYFLFNKRANEAKSLLHGEFIARELRELEPYIFFDDWILTGWLSAMFVLTRNFPDKLESITPEMIIRNYRHKAVRESIVKYFAGQISKKELTEARKKMTWLEYFQIYLPARSYGVVKGKFKLNFLADLIYKIFYVEDTLNHKTGAVMVSPPAELHPEFQSILDVVTSLPGPAAR